MKEPVIAAMGHAYGKLYVELQGAREALDAALAEVGELQEACGKQKAETLRLRAALEEIAERAGNTQIGWIARSTLRSKRRKRRAAKTPKRQRRRESSI